MSFQSVKKKHSKLSRGSCGGFFVVDSMWQLDSTNCSFLTHKDTFMHPHLTKQPTGNWTDTSLSARCSLFSKIAAPAVIKPGSHFLSLCRANACSALWVRVKDTNARLLRTFPLPTSAGSRKSALPLPLWEGHIHNCRIKVAFSSLCKTLHHPLTLYCRIMSEPIMPAKKTELWKNTKCWKQWNTPPVIVSQFNNPETAECFFSRGLCGRG